MKNNFLTLIDHFFENIRHCVALFVEDIPDHFYLHPGFSHMGDEKGNKQYLFKKYLKIMIFLYKPPLVLIVIQFNHFLCDESFCKEKLISKICGF